MSDINLSISLKTSELISSAKKAQDALSGIAKTGTRAGAGLSRAANTAASSWSVFTGVVTSQAVIGGISAVTRVTSTLAAKVINTAASFETLESQLTTVTGSADVAKKLLEDIAKFSARTPFQFPDLARTSKQLLSFGFAQDEVLTKLQQIGDVSSASGANLGEVGLIFGQVAAAGKLTGERLLQFQERSIQIGPAIAKTMGVAENAVKDLVSQGRVSFSIFEKAFKSLSDKGGVAFGGMARQSETLEGRLSTLNDTITLLFKSIGESLRPIAKSATSALTDFIQVNQDLLSRATIEGVSFLAKGFIGVARAVKIVIEAVQGFRLLWLDVKQVGLSTLAAILGAAVRGGEAIASVVNTAIQGLNKLGGFLSNFGITGPVIPTIKAANDSTLEFLDSVKQAVVETSDAKGKISGAVVDTFEGVIDIVEKSIDSLSKFNNIKLEDKKVNISSTGGLSSTRRGIVDAVSGRGNQRVVVASDSAAPSSSVGSQIGENIISAVNSGLASGDAEQGATTVVTNIATTFATQILSKINPIFGAIGGIVGSIIDKLSEGPEAASKFFTEFNANIPKIIENISAAMPAVADALAEQAPTITAALVRQMPNVAASLVKSILNSITGIGGEFGRLVSVGFQTEWLPTLNRIGNRFRDFANGIQQVFNAFQDVGRQIADAIIGPLQRLFDRLNIGNNIGGSGLSGADIASGGLSSVFGFATGGAIVNGSGVRDSVPALLTPGEVVVDRTTGPKLREFLNEFSRNGMGGSGSSDAILAQILDAVQKPQQANVTLNLDGEQLANAILNLTRNNARLS